MDIKILGNLLRETIDRGNFERPSPPGYSKEDYGRSWSSQEWKSGVAEQDRSEKLEVNSWDSLQKVDPHREEPLLGRNAHLQGTERLFTIERGNLCQRISKNWLILKISSWEVTQQNL